jgi:hypothetical protein
MAQTRTVQNLTPVVQKVVWTDRFETIQPYSVREVPVDLGQTFVDRRPGMVVWAEKAAVPRLQAGERPVWVANATGNPFLPKKVYDKIVRKGEEKLIELDNPLCTPVILKCWMSQGQLVQACERDANANESVNLPKLPIIIPPYQRVCVGAALADWLVRRDQQQLKHHHGKLAIVEEPAAFEPTEQWSLNDIREYCEFVDGETFVRKHEVYGDVLGPTEKEVGDDATAAQEAKVRLLHWLFFRLIDPLYVKPARKDYEQWRAIMAGHAPPPTRKESQKPAREAQI